MVDSAVNPERITSQKKNSITQQMASLPNYDRRTRNEILLSSISSTFPQNQSNVLLAKHTDVKGVYSCFFGILMRVIKWLQQYSRQPCTWFYNLDTFSAHGIEGSVHETMMTAEKTRLTKFLLAQCYMLVSCAIGKLFVL